MKQSIDRSINKYLPRGGFARKVSILTGGTALAQGIAVLASPALTRLYAPEAFGTLQIFVSIMALALVASGGRYEIAILLPEDDQSAVDVLALALFCICLTTCVVCGVVEICHVWWILPRSLLSLRRYLWLLPVSLFGAGVYQTLSYWALRQNAYRQIASTKFAQVGSQVTTQTGMGFALHGDIFGLLLGDSVGRIMGSGAFLRRLWANHAAHVRAVRWQRMWKLALRYRDYPIFSMWGALINASGLALPSLFLAQYYSTEGIGWFALVNRVLGVPTALLGQTIAQVYTAEAAKLARENPQRLLRVFLRTSRHMLGVGIVPCAAFMLASPIIFQTIFGPPWREAGEYARYLAPMFYASFVNSPVTMTLNILERQTTQLIWDTFRLLVTVTSIAIPHSMHYGVPQAIFCYGAGMTLMYATHWTLSYFAIREAANNKRKQGLIVEAIGV